MKKINKKISFIILSAIVLVATVLLSWLLEQYTEPSPEFGRGFGTGLLCWIYLFLLIFIGFLSSLFLFIMFILRKKIGGLKELSKADFLFWFLLFPMSTYTLCFSVWALAHVILEFIKLAH